MSSALIPGLAAVGGGDVDLFRWDLCHECIVVPPIRADWVAPGGRAGSSDIVVAGDVDRNTVAFIVISPTEEGVPGKHTADMTGVGNGGARRTRGGPGSTLPCLAGSSPIMLISSRSQRIPPSGCVGQTAISGITGSRAPSESCECRPAQGAKYSSRARQACA